MNTRSTLLIPLVAAFLLGCGAALAQAQHATSTPSANATTPLAQIAGAPVVPARPAGDLNESPQVRDLHEAARELIEDQRYEQAVAKLDSALTAATEDYYELHWLMAYAKLRLGRPGEARTAAEQALSLRPDSADVHHLLGLLYRQQQQPDRAVAHLRSATLAQTREPNNPRVTAAWFDLGLALREQGYWAAAADALAEFDQAVFDSHSEHRHAPEVAPLLRQFPFGVIELRLELLERLGRREAAVAAAAGAAQQQPENAVVGRLYAQALLAAGAAQKADEFCRARLEGGEANSFLHLALQAARDAGTLEAWVAELERGATDVAQIARLTDFSRGLDAIDAPALSSRLWRAALTLNPDDPTLAWSLAVAQRAAGQADAALQTLLAALDRPEPGWPAQAAFAEWVHPARLPDETRTALTRAVAALPATLPGRLVAAATLAALGNNAPAEEQINTALRDHPEAAWAHVLAGQLHLRAYRWDAAGQSAAAALKLRNTLAAAHFVKAEALAGLDDNDAAEAEYRAALKSGDPAHTLALARHHRRLGNAQTAQRFYQQTLTLDRANAEAFEDVIDSYLTEGKGDIASTQAEKAESAPLSNGALRRIRTTIRFMHAPFRDEHLDELACQFEQHPDDVSTGLKLAAGHYLRDRADASLAVVRQVLEHAPAENRGLILLARLHARQFELARSVEVLAQLAERYPNRQEVLSLLADCHLQQFEVAPARALLTRLSDLPGISDEVRRAYRLRLLDAFADFRDFDDALTLVDRWIAAEPKNTELPRQRLMVLLMAKRFDAAVAFVEERLDAAPTDPEARALYLAGCIGAKAFDRVEQRLRGWLEESPGDAGLMARLVGALIEAKRPDDALAEISAFTPQTWDESLQRRVWMGQAHAAASRFDEAAAEFDALLEEGRVPLAPMQRATIHQTLIITLTDAGQYDLALQRLARWEAAGAAAPLPRLEALELRVRLLQAAARTEEYERAALELLELLPNHPGLQNDLGYQWLEAGKHAERATQMIRNAVALEPLNAAFLDSLGWAYYKNGDFSNARLYLERANRLRDGRSAESVDHLGDAEYRLGNVDLARQHWQDALALAHDEAQTNPRRDPSARIEALQGKLAAAAEGKPVETAPTFAELKSGTP